MVPSPASGDLSRQTFSNCSLSSTSSRFAATWSPSRGRCRSSTGRASRRSTPRRPRCCRGTCSAGPTTKNCCTWRPWRASDKHFWLLPSMAQCTSSPRGASVAPIAYLCGVYSPIRGEDGARRAVLEHGLDHVDRMVDPPGYAGGTAEGVAGVGRGGMHLHDVRIEVAVEGMVEAHVAGIARTTPSRADRRKVAGDAGRECRCRSCAQ